MRSYKQFHFFLRLYSANKIRCSVAAEFSTLKLTRPILFGTSILGASYVSCVSHPEESLSKELTTVHLKKNLEESCLHSVASISTLIEEVSVAISESAIQYKDCLNELISSLEKFKSLEEYHPLREEAENNIIAARASVTDSKKEFLNLITIIESIGKVTSAVSELSFLIGSESSAMLLFETSNSLQKRVNDEILDVKRLENMCHLVEKNLIEATKI